jgi:hypothetical protein
VSRDGFCPIATLQNPLDAMPAFNHTPASIQDGDGARVLLAQLQELGDDPVKAVYAS